MSHPADQSCGEALIDIESTSMESTGLSREAICVIVNWRSRPSKVN